MEDEPEIDYIIPEITESRSALIVGGSKMSGAVPKQRPTADDVTELLDSMIGRYTFMPNREEYEQTFVSCIKDAAVGKTVKEISCTC